MTLVEDVTVGVVVVVDVVEVMLSKKGYGVEGEAMVLNWDIAVCCLMALASAFRGSEEAKLAPATCF